MAEEMTIQIAENDDAIRACFHVTHQLRPHLDADDFLATVRRLQQGGFHMAFVRAGGEVRAVAGFRIMEMLWCGRHVYVDDLVTAPESRSRGHGAALLAWVGEYARRQGCVQLHLDSGVQRHDAHRFYLRERMRIVAYHFLKDL